LHIDSGVTSVIARRNDVATNVTEQRYVQMLATK